MDLGANDISWDNLDGRAKLWSGGAPVVVVVQTAEVYDGDDPAAVARRLGDSRDRRILVEHQVSSPLVVVGKVPLEVPTQRTLIPHGHVVETLAAD
jgi:hypothetical protein